MSRSGRGSGVALHQHCRIEGLHILVWSNGPLPTAMDHTSTSPNWKLTLKPVSGTMCLTSLETLSECHGEPSEEPF